MDIVLINPNTLIQRSDPLTTGIFYFPITLAYLAASLRQAGHDVHVVDAFGLAPKRVRRWSRWWIQGLLPEEVADIVAPLKKDVLFVYAGNLVAHEATISILKTLNQRWPRIPSIVVENTQAVTAYSLQKVLDEFFAAGAHFILTGESEQRGPGLIKELQAGRFPDTIDGVYGKRDGKLFGVPAKGFIQDIDRLPLPAWELFPLKNYWSLHYAHGPTEGKILPILTSRGCPYPCGFCVVPETNKLRWRSRSPESVVDEMEHWKSSLGVTEFHIEDLNPTVNEERMRKMSEEISKRKLGVSWKIVAGTKLDVLKKDDTIDQMARAGCRYISLSPESGSPRVLSLMKKPFFHSRGLELVGRAHQLGVRSQACFVLGYPDENDEDRKLTRRYIRQLAKQGLDEVALFVCTPVPGSSIYGQETGYSSMSELSFSPQWRKSYAMLSHYRLLTYLWFIACKLIYHPIKLLRQPINFLLRRFETKMEMAPYRALSVCAWRLRSFSFPFSVRNGTTV